MVEVFFSPLNILLPSPFKPFVHHRFREKVRVVVVEMKNSVEEKTAWVQGYWDRKGENEIDVIAVNEFEKQLLIGEVKRNKSRINLHVVENKAADIVRKYADYQIEYKGFSLEDM